MRRRISLLIAVLLCAGTVLAACGTKDAESVVKELNKVVSNMESYQGKGTMTLNTGQQPLEYQVEVSYQKPDFYRIKLTNAKKDITQIVLRNEEGVFVLTPRLNKVFRFQSDWPANQGQVYLFQTLANSILMDNSRQFTIDKDAYVFDVMANYQNGSLARQKIWLDKSTYSPLNVEVSDAASTVMVQVKFDQFEFGPKLDKGLFDTQRNMGAEANRPTVAVPEDGELPGITEEGAAPESTDDGAEAPNEETGAVEGTEGAAKPEQGSAAGFTAMEPSYTPEGVAFLDLQDMKFGGKPAYMLRYSGTYDYTLIQTQPSDVAVSWASGTIVNLGFTVGSMTGDEEGVQKTLTWTYEGIEYRLASGTLPETEMLRIAQSVQGEMGK